MKTSEKTGDLCLAMSQFQSKLITLTKDTKAYNYKYTTLASIWESFRPFLSELGLFIFQDVVTTSDGVKVSTRITHVSDQWIETDYILIPMSKFDAHSTGSACTYGRRYSLSCALGIVCDEDDDGNKAQQNAPRPITKKPDIPKVDMHIWYDDMSKTFDKDLLKSYVLDCMVKFEKSESDTINQLAFLPLDKF